LCRISAIVSESFMSAIRLLCRSDDDSIMHPKSSFGKLGGQSTEEPRLKMLLDQVIACPGPDEGMPIRLRDHSIRTKKAYVNCTASAMSFWISSGSPLAGSRRSEIAFCGQWATHTPQPMQAS
jgi:hypothetical protein